MLPSLRILVATMMSSLVFIGFALSFVLSGDDLLAPPGVGVLAGQLVAALASHALIEAVGYRTAALAPGTPSYTAVARARSAVQTGTFLRFALSEWIAIASLAMAFVVAEGGFVTYCFGAVLTLLLVGFHAYPWIRPLAKTRTSLERDGAPSFFHEAVGLPAPLPGAVQEL